MERIHFAVNFADIYKIKLDLYIKVHNNNKKTMYQLRNKNV